MNCRCGQPIEEARLELDLTTCRACAFANPVEKVRGSMIFDHKTAPTICVQSPEERERLARLDKHNDESRLRRRRGGIL